MVECLLYYSGENQEEEHWLVCSTFSISDVADRYWEARGKMMNI